MLTNFGLLTQNELTVWSRRFWKTARNGSLLMSFMGDDENSMIQRITELRSTNDGARAVITLVNDAIGDGVVGDNELEGNEEALRSSDKVINMDQWRTGHRSQGEMADMRSVVKFRGTARNVMGYTASDRVDQMCILSMSGVSYAFNCDGSPRVGSQLPNIKFASDVVAPSANRGFRWSASSTKLLPLDTTQIAAGDTPSWKMLVQAKAQAEKSYIRPLRSSNGISLYNVFMTPDGIAKLKQDSDFIEAWKHAEARGKSNPIFKGTPLGGTEGIYLDGLNILSYRRVFNTTGAASGSKWGSGGTIDGQRVLFCGAQALGFADVGNAKYTEKVFDYDNSPGIAVAKKLGILKPQFYNIYTKSTEDHGVMVIDTAI